MSYKVKVSGYSEAGASHTRRATKTFIPNSRSPAEDIDQNNNTLRQRCRMLYMSSPVATSAIKTNRTKIVGTGLTLQTMVDADVLGLTQEEAEAWQRKTEREFSLWADRKRCCDATGMNNFAAIQQLVTTSWLMSGDVFALIKRAVPTPMQPYSLRLQLVEADLVSTPTNWAYGYSSTVEGKIPDGKPGAGHLVHDGVEVDEAGMAVAYHVCNRYPGTYGPGKVEWTRVLAYGDATGMPNILHVSASERCGQYRGVPYLAQVIEPLLQLRRYTESEMLAALVQSMFTAWIETETDPAQIPFNEVGPVGGEDGEKDPDSNDYQMGAGGVIVLKPGEKVVFGNPNRPTTGFDTFVKRICQLVGAALEEPYDVLLKEFNSSYSASRAALLEVWEAITMKRSWLVDDFCQPVYETWLAEAVALGRIAAPGFFADPALRSAWCQAQWIGPVQGSLDPRKEIEADLTMAASGVKTMAQVTAERGGDWNANMKQAETEQDMMRTVFSAATTAPKAEPEPEPEEPGE